VAALSGVGHTVGLAQRRRSAQGHGGRTLLVKLAQQGLIALPERRQVPTNRMRCGAAPTPEWAQPSEVIAGALAQLAPLSLQEVSAEPAARAWVKATLARFHYLGFGGAVGENVQYVVRDGQGRPLACLVFGAAAWKCQDRDRFIGWTAEQRQKHLGWVANNSRFLILPWIEAPGLGSWILGQVARRDRPRLAGQIRPSGGGAGDLR